MSAHVLLNLLNKLEIKCEACRAFYLFRNEFNNIQLNKSMNVRFYLSYDFKITEMSFLA